MGIRVLIADDHPIVLDGLARLFEAAGDVDVISRCGDGEEALKVIRVSRPDVAVVDVRMPRVDGVGVLRAVRNENLTTRVVLLTAEVSSDQVVEAMRLGVSGIVLKDVASTLLLQAVRKVHQGGRWIDHSTTGETLERLLRKQESLERHASILTHRELEIVRMAASGLRNKEIARDLSITEGTVKIHLHNVYEKLGIESRVELSLYARDQGLV